MKRAEFDLQQGSLKKQMLDQQTEEREEEAGAQGDSDQEVEELKLYMRITPKEGVSIEAIPLATKPLVIIKYKMVKEGNISTYHITRAGGSIKRYTSMINLLKNIDREDLETLWKLVKDKCRNTRPEGGYKRVLGGDLKVMFEPDIECEVCPFTRWNDHIQRPYANAKPKWTFDHYLNNNHKHDGNYEANNGGNIQGGQRCMENLTHEPSAYKIRRFKMTKYTFEADKEFVAIKELEHINRSETNMDARHAYQ
uniref:Uncharacterized protein n=1 Tax=Tanacetum cinerariifolium TaxID=118510 RepID=A0A6L2JZQ0_TANCI|nr:hypothetical protein [Tanacetum cinerariifolium]